MQSDLSEIEVFLITPYINDEIEEKIIGFQAHSNTVALVKLNPEEKD